MNTPDKSTQARRCWPPGTLAVFTGARAELETQIVSLIGICVKTSLPGTNLRGRDRFHINDTAAILTFSL